MGFFAIVMKQKRENTYVYAHSAIHKQNSIRIPRVRTQLNIIVLLLSGCAAPRRPFEDVLLLLRQVDLLEPVKGFQLEDAAQGGMTVEGSSPHAIRTLHRMFFTMRLTSSTPTLSVF